MNGHSPTHPTWDFLELKLNRRLPYWRLLTPAATSPENASLRFHRAKDACWLQGGGGCIRAALASLCTVRQIC